MTRKMDQLREGRRGFQARTDLGMPMYSSGRSTAGISRGTGLGLEAAAPAALPAVELDAVVDEEAAGVAGVAAGAVELDGVGGVELMAATAALGRRCLPLRVWVGVGDGVGVGVEGVSDPSFGWLVGTTEFRAFSFGRSRAGTTPAKFGKKSRQLETLSLTLSSWLHSRNSAQHRFHFFDVWTLSTSQIWNAFSIHLMDSYNHPSPTSTTICRDCQHGCSILLLLIRTSGGNC